MSGGASRGRSSASEVADLAVAASVLAMSSPPAGRGQLARAVGASRRVARRASRSSARCCRRRAGRRNPIGWLFLLAPRSRRRRCRSSTTPSTGSYDGRPDPAAGIRTVAWLGDPLGYLWFVLIGVLLPLLFPDGRPAVAALAAGAVARRLRSSRSPRGRPRAASSGSTRRARPASPTRSASRPAADVAARRGRVQRRSLSIVVLALAAQRVVRFRRSRGIERQQLKWIAYASRVMLLGLARGGDRRGRRVGPVGDVGWTFFLAVVVVRHAGRDRRRDPPPPALRHRPRDPAHARLRRADAHARRRVPRQRAAGRPRGRATRASRWRSRRSRSPRCSGRRCARIQASSTAASTAGATTRRDARGVRRAAARRARPRDAGRRPARRRAGDGPARARLAVAGSVR